MADCQLVLRYFALHDEGNIRGSMKSMLDRAMQSRMSTSAEDAKAERVAYNDRLTFLNRLFDGRTFRLQPDEQGRARISAALYDASMIALNRNWIKREEIEADKVGVATRLATALKTDEQLALLTGQANTAQAVKDRIALMASILLPEG